MPTTRLFTPTSPVLPLLLLLAAPFLAAQNGTTTYPGSPDTNANLGVAVDRFTARISGSHTSSTTTWTLRNLSRALVNNMFLSAGNEIVMVTAIPRSDQVTVTRGVCGTTATAHNDGDAVGAVWNSCLHNGLRSAIQALEAGGGGGGAVSSVFTRTGAVTAQSGDYTAAQVGALATTALDLDPAMIADSNSRIPSQAAVVSYVATHSGNNTGPLLSSTAFTFSQTPGGALSAGSNTITLTPVPLGINGFNTNHYVYISGGTGTAEPCLISGGTATSGTSTGTLAITCTNVHSGAWTISSATSGIQEALWYAGAGSAVYVPTGTYTLHSTITPPVGSVSLQGAGRRGTFLVMANGSNYGSVINVVANNTTIRDLWIDGNFANQTSGAGNLISLGGGTNTHRVVNVGLVNAGMGGPTAQSLTYAILINGATGVEIADCVFGFNLGYDIGFNTVDATGKTYRGYSIHDNQFGTPMVTGALTPTNYWQTGTAGMYAIIANGYSDISVINNKVYGGWRPAVSPYLLGNPITLSNCRNCIITGNLVEGLGPGKGTIAVTSGSGTITGTSTYFAGGSAPWLDTGAAVEIEGDTTRYIITAVASTTSITVAPVVARTSATGLRYRISSIGDGIGCGGCTNTIISNNTVKNSHDNGIDLGEDGLFGSGNLSSGATVTGNMVQGSMTSGLWLGGVSDYIVAGNTFLNNGYGTAAGAYPTGILLANNSSTFATSNGLITGNILSDNQSPHIQKYGISVTGTTGGGNILGLNTFSGNGTAEVYTASTSVFYDSFLPYPSNRPAIVADLPTCSSTYEGREIPVTDANSTTFNAAIASGGSSHVKAYCNGTGWVVR